MNMNIDSGTRTFRTIMLAIVACLVVSMALRAFGVLPSAPGAEPPPESSFYEQ